MKRYIFKRVVTTIVSLFVVITITFFLMKFLPGGPFTTERRVAKTYQIINEQKANLNRGITEQYIDYIQAIVHLDFGESLQYKGYSVTNIISDSFRISLKVGSGAIIFSIIMGCILSYFGVRFYGKCIEKIISNVGMIIISVPGFIVTLVLFYMFTVKNSLFPISYEGSVYSILLPCIALGIYPTFYLYKIIKNGILQILKEPFIVTLKMLSISNKKIIFKYALKAVLPSLFAAIFPMAASLITGSAVVERVFGLPGISSVYIQSVLNRDYSLVMAITLLFSVILALCTFFADMLSAIVDKRITYIN